LLASKKVSGKSDPSRVYLELLSNHRDSGFIEILSEADHAFAAGYASNRAVRTWRERMKLLEKLGLIKTDGDETQRIKFVLLRPVDAVVKTLKSQNKLPIGWLNAYTTKQIHHKENM